MQFAAIILQLKYMIKVFYNLKFYFKNWNGIFINIW